MYESCWETTTPDWVFGLFIGCCVVALSAGAVWTWILTSAGSSPPPRPPRTWWRYLWVLVWTALLAWNLHGRISNYWETTQDAVLDVAVLLLAVAPVLISYVWVRRAEAAGVFPPARRAPFGAFWLLPALFLAAVAGGVWSLALQIASERPC